VESIATVLYARLRNVLAICNGMAPERAAALVGQLRNILEGPVAKQNGIVAMVRHDSILAVFSNDEATAPFGGVGASGTGSRHGGPMANIEAFTETQWVTLRGDLPAYPF